MKGRNVRWDNYKALLALLMVYGHTFRVVNDQFPKMGGLFIFIYLFHMPAFLFVSGMFSKKAAEHNDIRRVLSLFTQYLLVKFVLLISGMLIDGEVSYTNMLSVTGVAWFALSTMECLILTMLLKRVRRSYVFLLAVILGCLIGYCPDIGSFLSLSRTIVYFPYFYLGYCLNAEDIERQADRLSVKAVSWCVLALLFIVLIANASFVYQYSEFIKAKAYYGTYADVLVYPALGGLYRLMLYAIGFAMVFAALAVVPRCRIPVISGIGSRTLSVYVFHYVLVTLTYQNGIVKKFALAHFSSTVTIALFYLALSAAILAVSSLPPLEKCVRKITQVPQARESGAASDSVHSDSVSADRAACGSADPPGGND